VTTAQPPSAKADHRPYIEAVRVALLLKDLQVGVATFNSSRLRSAAMTLLAPDEEFDEPWHPTFTTAQFVELRWNEQDGWSLLALHPSETALLPTIWHRGFGVLLPPEEVAAWIDLLVTMPSAAPSREDGPYRSHQQHDPAFEQALAAFVH
jgi:Family of unknown function (DUF6292)